MSHTAIPLDELRVFQSLKDVMVVFDIGARDDVDYLILKPDIQLHAFEPNPVFFEELQAQVIGRKNVYANNFGCGDIEGTYEYNTNVQSIGAPTESGVVIKRLDDYIKENKIRRIDFLKIDTEGYELPVLKGMGEYLTLCRYIQYEQTNDIGEIESLLKNNGYTTYYTGYRNQLAVRNGEELPWIPEITQEGGQPEKSAANRL